MIRSKAAYVMAQETFALIYGEAQQTEISQLVDVANAPITPEEVLASPRMLEDIEIILSGWGGPKLDRQFLAAAPRLKAMFYGAGSASSIVTAESWQAGIIISTAYAANAVPVAEYCLATTLFSLKMGWQYIAATRRDRTFKQNLVVPGCYKSKVGLVSMGMVARTFRQLLRSTDMTVMVYDPHLSSEEARKLDVISVSLDELFNTCDVVSIHTPLLPETVGLIGRPQLERMKPGATMINTARGPVVDHHDLLEVLVARPDILAVLDVTDPEPPPPESPLYDLPNVILTPHIAGSLAGECRRMGQHVVDELRRYLQGHALRGELTPELAANTSHRPLDARISAVTSGGKRASALKTP